jgi:RES domain-containing protein
MSSGGNCGYKSKHSFPAVALIEVLANFHTNPKLLPETYHLIKVIAPQGLLGEVLASNRLPEGWRENVRETRALGDEWLATKFGALLVVPSVPSPESSNYLLNPLHRDAKKLDRVVDGSNMIAVCSGCLEG